MLLGVGGILLYAIRALAAPPEVYTCPYCGDTFPTKEERDAHILAVHPEVPPPIEPAIEVDRETAFWDKDTYLPGEFAILTVMVRNPTSVALTYDAVARGVIRFENSFTLAPGEERVLIFSGNAPSEGGAYSIVLDVYCGEEYIYSGHMPYLVVSPPAIGVQFIMLHGIFVDTFWRLGEDVYIKRGTLKNVGDKTGTTTVVGWWRVGNYGRIIDAYEETITLAPGESRDISYAITRAEMEAAQAEYFFPYYEWLYVCISVSNHLGGSTKYGYKYTQDTVSVETPEKPWAW